MNAKRALGRRKSALGLHSPARRSTCGEFTPVLSKTRRAAAGSGVAL
jgi:hypothetical protein